MADPSLGQLVPRAGLVRSVLRSSSGLVAARTAPGPLTADTGPDWLSGKTEMFDPTYSGGARPLAVDGGNRFLLPVGVLARLPFRIKNYFLIYLGKLHCSDLKTFFYASILEFRSRHFCEHQTGLVLFTKSFSPV